MAGETLFRISGDVATPTDFTHADLAAIDAEHQVEDVSRLDASRKGKAVRLAALLEKVGARETANYLGLHATADNFHASIPLEPVRDRAVVIYQLDGQPLSQKAGGPARFFIPDFAACHTDEIDECANVKYIDHIELTKQKGFDNRPEDDEEHEALHRSETR